MKIQFGRRFWIAATAAIVVFTVFMVGRNALHAVKIKRQINLLTREQAYYTEKIGQDSALLERLKYDDYLEEYARENYCMQRRNEHVYIMKEQRRQPRGAAFAVSNVRTRATPAARVFRCGATRDPVRR